MMEVASAIYSPLMMVFVPASSTTEESLPQIFTKLIVFSRERINSQPWQVFLTRKICSGEKLFCLAGRGEGRRWKPTESTVGQNQVVLRHLIIHCPTSKGVSEVSKQENE